LRKKRSAPKWSHQKDVLPGFNELQVFTTIARMTKRCLLRVSLNNQVSGKQDQVLVLTAKNSTVQLYDIKKQSFEIELKNKGKMSKHIPA